MFYVRAIWHVSRTNRAFNSLGVSKFGQAYFIFLSLCKGGLARVKNKPSFEFFEDVKVI